MNMTSAACVTLPSLALFGLLAASPVPVAAQDAPKSCRDGQYQGADGVRKRWVHDEYVWAVTRDFARRFCMPEALIDDELQGAEAVAFRIKSGTRRVCEMQDGKDFCSTPLAYRGALRFEVYLKREAKVPAAQPEVEFASRFDEHSHSGHIIATDQNVRNAQRARTSGYYPPLGLAPKYHWLYTGHPTEPNHNKPSWQWGVVTTREGKVHSATNAMEMLFVGNWSDGIDLLALDGSSGHLTQTGRDWKGARVAIVLQQTSPRPQTTSEDLSIGQKRVPEGFAHAVTLPASISRAILAADQGIGADWDAAIRATITNRK